MAFVKNIYMNFMNKTFEGKSILPLIATGKFSKNGIKGTSVVIDELADLTSYDYDPSGAGNVNYAAVDATPFSITLDQSRIVSPKINAIDEWNTDVSLQESTASRAVKVLAKDMETYALGVARDEAGDVLDLEGVTLTKTNILTELFVPLNVKFNENDVDDENRIVILDAATYGVALEANILQKVDGIESTGNIGKVLDMTVISSNNLPANVNTGSFKDMIALIPDALGFEASLSEAKVIDGLTFVGKAIQMLEVYGAGVPLKTAKGVIKISFDETA